MCNTGIQVDWIHLGSHNSFKVKGSSNKNVLNQHPCKPNSFWIAKSL